MPNYSQIQIIGHAGKDPELRLMQNGDAVASFSVAVKVRKDETTWFEVSVFGKSAENYVIPYLKKGGVVFVSGTPSLNVYEKKDGTSGGSIRIAANQIQIMGGRDEAKETHEAGGSQAQRGYQAGPEEISDEIPF